MSPQISHMAQHFGIVLGSAICWQCQQNTSVSALLLDKFQQRFDEDDPWEQTTEPSLLGFISFISPEAENAWLQEAPLVALAATRSSEATYYANHCSHCGAVQGDWHLREPGAAFFPVDATGIDSLTLRWIRKPIQAAASSAQSSWQDELVARYPQIRQ